MPGYVGTAPGTSTIFIPSAPRPGLGDPCGPPNPWAYVIHPYPFDKRSPAAAAAPIPAAGTRSGYLNPYGSEIELKGKPVLQGAVISAVSTLHVALAFVAGVYAGFYLGKR